MSKYECECMGWCRTDGWLTRHHPNCGHYNESLIDVWKVDTGDGVCLVDKESEIKDLEVVSVEKIKVHKEIFEALPIFQGGLGKSEMSNPELQRYILDKLIKEN